MRPLDNFMEDRIRRYLESMYGFNFNTTEIYRALCLIVRILCGYFAILCMSARRCIPTFCGRCRSYFGCCVLGYACFLARPQMFFDVQRMLLTAILSRSCVVCDVVCNIKHQTGTGHLPLQLQLVMAISSQYRPRKSPCTLTCVIVHFCVPTVAHPLNAPALRFVGLFPSKC